MYQNNANSIKAEKETPDESCLFVVENHMGKLALKSDNEKYVTFKSNSFRADNINTDVWSIFSVETPNVKSGMNKYLTLLC